MRTIANHDPISGEIYLAGERVEPGTYRQIGGPRELILDHEDYLPASLDGRVACYERLRYTWGQMQISDRSGGDRSPSLFVESNQFLLMKK